MTFVVDHTFIPNGTRVRWSQRGTGARKEGVIVDSHYGLYGPTYRCRADNWSKEWTTYVHEKDLEIIDE